MSVGAQVPQKGQEYPADPDSSRTSLLGVFLDDLLRFRSRGSMYLHDRGGSNPTVDGGSLRVQLSQDLGLTTPPGLSSLYPSHLLKPSCIACRSFGIAGRPVLSALIPEHFS